MLDPNRSTPGKICADCGAPAQWRNLENDFAYCLRHRPPQAIELNATEHNIKTAAENPAPESERVEKEPEAPVITRPAREVGTQDPNHQRGTEPAKK